MTEALLGLGLPTVVADTDFSYPGVVSIDVDDRAVGAAAAEAFRQAGFRHFACLGNGSPYSEQRIDGFVQALDLSVSVHTETAFKAARYSEHFVAPSAALRLWLESLPKPVAVFAVHDPLGRLLCGTCQELGIAVPDQVAVIGANNDELVCGLSYPMLSSVAIPWDAIGTLAGELMQSLLAGQDLPTDPVLVPPGGVVLRYSANFLAVDDPQLRRAMSYLYERMQDSISVGSMCGELRVARRTLERKFKEFYRSTPWEMLCRPRSRRACHRLLTAGAGRGT